MKPIGLLLTSILLLVGQTRALVENPPTEVPCMANVDNEPTCNDNGPVITVFSGATGNSSDPHNNEFSEDLRLISGFESSIGGTSSTSFADNGTVDHEVQTSIKMEDPMESSPQFQISTIDDARNGSSKTEDEKIKIIDTEQVSDVNSSIIVSQNDESSLSESSRTDSVIIKNSEEGSHRNETTFASSQNGDSELAEFPHENPNSESGQGVSQDEKILKDDRPKTLTHVVTHNKSSIINENTTDMVLVDEPKHDVILNGTSNRKDLETNVNESNITLLEDTPSVSRDTDFSEHLEKENISPNVTVGHLQDNKEHTANNSYHENIAKSIDEGNLNAKVQNSSLYESRSLSMNQTINRNLVNEKVKLDDKTELENFPLHDHDSLEINETSHEQTPHEIDLNKPQDSSSILTEDAFVRKCCEDHEIFSLDTQECEAAIDDPDFMMYVQNIILINSTKKFKTLTGRIPICPGSTEPPIVSEARYDTHSLEAFGYIRDEAHGVEYDHDHYCLELAVSTHIDVATLVLAHCLPFREEAAAEVFVEPSVRKCCGKQEFYSIRSQNCEPAGGDPGFLDAVREKLVSKESSADLKHITGLLQKCPGSGEPPMIDEATSFNYTLLPLGHLKNLYSTVTYNHEHYCLELAAASRDQLANAPITLAYCLPHEEKESYRALPTETVVRKCCQNNEYFSSKTQQCEVTENETGFEDFVRGIQIESSTNNLLYRNGKINWCPSINDLPIVEDVYPRTHALLSFGHLKDIQSGIKYEHDNYCLEVAADSPDNLNNGFLVAAYCPIFSVQVLVKKCCGLNQYYNKSSYCENRLENMSNYNSLIHDFFRSNPTSISTSITTGEIMCKNVPPKMVDTDDTYLDETGRLCEVSNGVCYSPSAYCIEHFETDSDEELKSSAYICPTNVFNKCCPVDKILTDNGCVEKGEDYVVSSHINQLMEIMIPHTGFQTLGDETCDKQIINSTSKDIRWWVNKSGYLSLRSNQGKITIKHYCVDDYQNDKHESETVVVMCTKEVDHILPEMMLDNIKVRKCCGYGQYFQDDDCVTDNLGLDLLKEPQFVAANVTELRYTTYPRCQSRKVYHKYPVGQRTTEDFATLGTDQEMTIVSLDSGCVITQKKLEINTYCIDFDVSQRGIEPVIIVCSDLWENILRYQEKYSLTAVLLGISCTALTATAFSLISMRVRRGLVTVKKVNTLAGRILLSYVSSYLLAFLLLAIGMKTNTLVGYSCSILAGFLLFFLLAAFQWNTSICLESLLLTLRVSTSERNRYLCHSLWAWGVPGIVTTIALTLDHHKDSLPCSIIIPRIGLYRCFFSDRNAQLLYLYLPMFFSLCANMFLLMAARYVRSAKLRRLEKGGGRPKNTVTEMKNQQSKTSDQNTSQVSTQSPVPQSGLRTHQTRNLWTECMKLVVWSGATWMAEVVSFLLTRFVDLSESWYNYLWYLPSSINSLRGVGIFIILVLTPENRHKIFRVFGNLGSWAGSGSLARHSRSGDGHSTSGNHQSTMAQGRSTDSRAPGRRNMSIATTVTQLSSIRSGTTIEPRHEIGTIKVHPRVAMSVSQIDTRRGSASSQTSDLDGSELDSDSGAGSRRKSSLANFGLASLPSVDEEDVFEGAASTSPATSIDATQSTSDV